MTKRIVAEIIVSLVLLASLQVAAANENEKLDIFGNANEDATINMQDVIYTEQIILGLIAPTRLADANYDSEMNMQDVTQIELISLGREKTLTFIDSTENAVTVSKPIERIVVLNTDLAEAIVVLGGTDKVVGIAEGITKHERFFPELSKVKSVGGWSTPDLEAILMCDPDAVGVYAKWPSTEKLDDKLPGTINVIRLDFYKAETLREEMIKLGYILGKRDDADEYLDWHDKYVNVINERVSGIPVDEKVRVFIDGGGGKKTGRRAYSIGTGMHDLCVVAGGIDISTDHVTGYADVETEWILEQNPDVIAGISYQGGYETDNDSEMKAHYDEIVELPGFEHLAAVKNDSVYIMTNSFAFAPHYPAALATMAKWFYPHIFEDLGPQVIHQEYVTEFLGSDYNLDEHGVFVYPPLARIFREYGKK